MLYDDDLDRLESNNATRVRIYTIDDVYDKMYDWCIEQDTGNKFSSELHSRRFGNDIGRGSFYFSNADDALLFRLRWAEHAV